MKFRQLFIVILVVLLVYYYWYTYKKPCKCNCKEGGSCTCKKNRFEKVFEAVNKNLDIQRVPCTKSPGTDDIPKEGPIQEFDKAMKQEGVETATDEFLDAKEKTNDEKEFAEVNEEMAKENERIRKSVEQMNIVKSKLEAIGSNYKNLIRNMELDEKRPFMQRAGIAKNAKAKLDKVSKQLFLLEKVINSVLSQDYPNLGFGVYVLKNAKKRPSDMGIENHIIDHSGQTMTVICKKRDVLNIGEVAQCEDIVPLYWKEFDVLPEWQGRNVLLK